MTKGELKLTKAKRKRLVISYLILTLLFFGLLGRLLYLMIFDSKKLNTIANSQWTSYLKIDAKRGNILDRNNHELAVSADVYRVDLDLTTLRETLKEKKLSTEAFASELGDILKIKSEDIISAMNKTVSNGLPASWAPLKRQIEKSEADKVKALKIFGIIVSQDTKRFYPQDEFLSHVIGNINGQGNGNSGVEQSYNKELAGEPGYITFEKDSKSNQLFYADSRYTVPKDGESIQLTVDEVIQRFTEKAAEKALSDNKAKGVSIIITNPKNGEVLAMVNKPDYNLSNPQAGAKTSEELNMLWKNPSVENVFEPGSIFKVITAAAAMENGTSNENDSFTCSGSLKVSNRIINCWQTKGHGTENFVDILKNSCNVGFIKVGEKLGKDNLNSFIKKLGFGQKTGIDLPSEASGLVKDVNTMNEVDLATMSFGQGISVTQIQYMAAFNAIANGGTWIKPHIMRNLVHYDNKGNIVIDKKFKDYSKRKVLDTGLTSTLRGYMEKVVSEGVGSKAYIKGLSIGGKTGTAQKAGAKGGYEDNKYMSSFAGLAPVSDPKISLIVTIDEPDPSNYYAGQVAAPVAKDLFTEIFNYIALNPDVLTD
ncbi:stage V sporulation protein D [Candidatus Clostridium radicumherbarum]|uniref:Stage V sporulation protein D n=1 Tax=Candidatus Clostridium radicumherbarum TaxID=3381662 RepID=A0ABW8TPH7_9CLOT